MDATGKLNILVIDDDEDMCTLIKQYLTGNSFIKAVFLAPSTTVATTKMQNVAVDLVICDYKLANGKNGIQYLNGLINANSNVKYLLISGQMGPDDLAVAISVVGQNILAKPFTREKLLQKMAAILGRKI